MSYMVNTPWIQTPLMKDIKFYHPQFDITFEDKPKQWKHIREPLWSHINQKVIQYKILWWNFFSMSIKWLSTHVPASSLGLCIHLHKKH